MLERFSLLQEPCGQAKSAQRRNRSLRIDPSDLDAVRGEAHRFYERLGFVGSHIGFKYRLR